MKETQLQVEKVGDYNNFIVKTKYQRNNGMLVIKDGQKVVAAQGLKDGECATVTKSYAEGKEIQSKFKKQGTEEYSKSFICSVEQGGVKGTFFLNEWEHDKFSAVGGEGDEIRIGMTVTTEVNKHSGAQYEKQALSFERVE